MAKDYEGVGDLTGPPEKAPAKRRPKDAEPKERSGASEKESQGLGDVTGPPESMGKAPKAPAKKMAKGGYVSAADGCAQRGKTRGRMV